MLIDEQWLRLYCALSGWELEQALQSYMEETTDERAELHRERERLIARWHELLQAFKKTPTPRARI